MLTDGISESWDQANQQSGEAGVVEIVWGHAADSSPERIETILDAVEAHTRGHDSHDDRTVRVVKQL